MTHHTDRRDFLKRMTALGLAGAPIVAAWRPGLARAGVTPGESRMKVSYDPAAKFEIKVSEVEFLRTPAGRHLTARIYQPQGPGPFPTVLDLHGGAWRRKDRFAEEAPYPASVQDANYGARWLKWKAAEWSGDASKLGVYGSSSGGHVAQLLAMRPRDARYNA